jgi:hypothetical protein
MRHLNAIFTRSMDRRVNCEGAATVLFLLMRESCGFSE